MTQLSQGVNAKVEVYDGDGGFMNVLGLESFQIGQDSRELIDVPAQFSTTRKETLVGMKGTINFSCSGFYRLDDDEGQQKIQDWYNDETEISPNSIKFWIDSYNYITPKGDSGYARITSLSEISQSAEGFASWGFEGIFHGDYQVVTNS